jgi:N utilization substance protein A
LKKIAETPIDEMTQIEGFDEDVAQELINRAQNWLAERAAELAKKQKELGLNDDLVTFEGLSADVIIKLGEAGVKCRDDLADLATDELIEIIGEGAMKPSDAEALIMRARAHWFESENDNADDDEAVEQASNG